MEPRQVLTDEEVQALIVSLMNARGDRGFTEDDAEMVVAWAEQARIGTTLLALTLSGAVLINVSEDGEIGFGPAA